MTAVHERALIPPHSLEAEQAVIGGVLLFPRTLAEVKLHVIAADFYHPAHRSLFSGMLRLDGDGKPVDAIQLLEQLRKADQEHVLRFLGGEAYFAELTSAVVTVENIAFHAQIVAGKAAVRRTVEAAQTIAAEGYGDHGDGKEYLQRAETLMAQAARSGTFSGGFRPIGDVMVEVHRDLEQAYKRLESGAPPLVIPTGFAELDQVIVGWEPATMNVIGARPSVGKTALMMDLVEAAAANGWPCYVGTREMRDRALLRRRLAAVSGVDHARLRSGAIRPGEWADICAGESRLAALPVWLSKPFSSISDFERDVRIWRARYVETSTALVTLDYLQLLTPARGGPRRDITREREVGEMSERLKSLAVELDLAMLVLSQFSRASDKDKRKPRLSDFRDTGSIEQDADVALLLSRDKHEATVDVAKQRNGPVDEVPLYFDAARVRFLDAEPSRLPPQDQPAKDKPKGKSRHGGYTRDPEEGR